MGTCVRALVFEFSSSSSFRHNRVFIRALIFESFSGSMSEQCSSNLSQVSKKVI